LTNSIKAAFDSIHAEESLKAGTVIYLREQMRKQGKPRGFATARRAAVAFASIFVILLGVLSYNICFTETMYVDIDVNPSLALSINRFDRVVGVHAYNADGTELLEAVNVKYKPYSDAVGILIDAMIREGYVSDNGLISITVQSDDKNRESNALSWMEDLVPAHYNTGEIEVFPVSDSTRNAASDLDLSPAVYLAIQELQAVDPTATVESCRGHSIRELRRMTEEHNSEHPGNGDNKQGNNGNNGNSSHGTGGHGERHDW